MAKHSRVYSSDQYQHSKCPAVVSSIMHEVVAPHVISICRTQPYTRSVIEPQSSSFRLFLRHFQAVSSPKSFDTFVIHFPTSSSQSFGHPTIAVPTVLLCQPNHLPYQTWLAFWNMGLTTLGGSGLTQPPDTHDVPRPDRSSQCHARARSLDDASPDSEVS